MRNRIRQRGKSIARQYWQRPELIPRRAREFLWPLLLFPTEAQNSLKVPVVNQAFC